jgi:hypothetical protein
LICRLSTRYLLESLQRLQRFVSAAGHCREVPRSGRRMPEKCRHGARPPAHSRWFHSAPYALFTPLVKDIHSVDERPLSIPAIELRRYCLRIREIQMSALQPRIERKRRIV